LTSTDNTRRSQTLKEHTSYKSIHSLSNSNPAVGRKLDILTSGCEANDENRRKGVLTEA